MTEFTSVPEKYYHEDCICKIKDTVGPTRTVQENPNCPVEGHGRGEHETGLPRLYICQCGIIETAEESHDCTKCGGTVADPDDPLYGALRRAMRRQKEDRELQHRIMDKYQDAVELASRLMSKVNRLRWVLEKVKGPVKYTLATIRRNNRIDVDTDDWTGVHRGRAESAVRQLDRALDRLDAALDERNDVLGEEPADRRPASG